MIPILNLNEGRDKGRIYLQRSRKRGKRGVGGGEIVRSLPGISCAGQVIVHPSYSLFW